MEISYLIFYAFLLKRGRTKNGGYIEIVLIVFSSIITYIFTIIFKIMIMKNKEFLFVLNVRPRQIIMWRAKIKRVFETPDG